MNKNTEYNESLAFMFAQDRKQWEKFVPYIASEFLKSFYENIDFMSNKVKKFSDNKKAYTPKNMIYDMKVIAGIIDLRNMITISKDGTIKVDIDKVDKTFTKIKDKKEVELLEKSVQEFDMQTKAESNNGYSFRTLSRYYSMLISYIKLSDFRTIFFKNVVQNSEFNDLGMNNIQNHDSVFSPKAEC